MKRKEKIVVIFVVLFAFLIFGNFFRFHLVTDTYRITDNDIKYIINLKCNEGRPIHALYFCILDILNIEINSISEYMLIYRINLTISILLVTVCIYLIYKMLINKKEKSSIYKKLLC